MIRFGEYFTISFYGVQHSHIEKFILELTGNGKLIKRVSNTIEEKILDWTDDRFFHKELEKNNNICPDFKTMYLKFGEIIIKDCSIFFYEYNDFEEIIKYWVDIVFVWRKYMASLNKHQFVNNVMKYCLYLKGKYNLETCFAGIDPPEHELDLRIFTDDKKGPFKPEDLE